MATQVAIGDLETWLSNQPENTADTPYEIEVTGLTTDNYTSLRTIIRGTTKYVDLSYTQLPTGITSLSSFFDGCSFLVFSPEIPEGVTNMERTFQLCTALKVPPTIPSSVTNMERTFQHCYSLSQAPILPSNVRYITGLFNMCTSLQQPPEIPSSVISMEQLFNNCSSLLVAPVIPSGIQDLTQCFMGCELLTVAPSIPDGVKNVSYMFLGCTSLTTPPVLPNGLLNADYAFYGCTSLLYKSLLPGSVTSSENCYTGVTQTRWGGSASQVDAWIPNQSNEFEVLVIGTERIVYGVSINNLSTWLQSQSENTTDEPFEVDILGITEGNYPSVKAALLANPTKFVDLFYTEIPSNAVLASSFRNCVSLVGAPILREQYLDYMFQNCVNLKKVRIYSEATSLSATFANCSSLTEPPEIPSSVANLSYTFMNTGLTRAPTLSYGQGNLTNMMSTFKGCALLNDDNIYIPSSVTNMNGCFEGCVSLENIKGIPASVTSMERAFFGCISLKTIDQLLVPLLTMKNNANFQDAFYGCTSLKSIGYVINEDSWKVWRLKFANLSGGSGTVEGEIFSANGTSVNINNGTALTIDKTNLKLPVLTDELWFPDNQSDNQIDAVIAKMIQYKYGVFNKRMLLPDRKSFVLWADNPNNLETNLPITGTSIPVGFIMPQYKKVDASDWLYLDGRDTTGTEDELRTVYPALYAYLGNTNVLPDYREFALVGAEQNTTDTIATHDVYTEGQGKDDAIQNITGYFQIRKMSNGANAVTSRSGAFTTSDQSSQADGFDFSGGEGKIHRVSFNSKNSARNDANANVTRGKRKAVYFYIKAM